MWGVIMSKEKWNVYKMNDYEWYASRLSIEETNEKYKELTGVSEEENPTEDIEVCDLDNECVWVEVTGFDSTEDVSFYWPKLRRDKPKVGEYRKDSAGLFKYMTYRQAVEATRDGIQDVYCIAIDPSVC